MVTRHKHVLLVLGWYNRGYYRGISRYAREHHWHVTTDMVHNALVPWGWQGDGVLSVLSNRRDLADFMQTLSVPKVDLGLTMPELNIPRVTPDNEAIGRMVAEYFLERGYRNYLCIDRWDAATERERRAGFVEALNAKKIESQLHSFTERGNPRFASWAERQSWLAGCISKLPKPLAVFAQHDTLAFDVVEAANNCGIRVPEEIALIGSENDEMACECCAVPLSSVDCNMEEVAYRGAALLDRMMNGESMPAAQVTRIAPVGIVDRKSSNMPAIRNLKAAMAMNFIRENGHKPIDITDVCTHVKLSKAGLQRAFLQELHQSPGAVLRAHRLLHIKKMLAETDKNLNEIAEASGYGSSIALCNAFRREFNSTPGEYRKHCRGE